MNRKSWIFALLVIVVAGCEPAYAQKVRFIKDLSIKSNENDEKTSFLSVENVNADLHGNIYALASRECKIQVYNPKGEYIRTIGKKGQGPGELEMPFSVLLDKDDHIYVFDFNKMAFVVFDPQGRYLKNLSTKGKFQSFPDRIFIDSRGNFVIGYESMSGDSFRISRFGREFDSGEDLYAKTGMVSFLHKPGGVLTQAPFPPGMVWTLDEKDNLYVCFNQTYDIEVHSPDLKLIRTISRKVVRDEVSRAEIEESLKRSKGLLTAGDFPKYKPALRRMFIVSGRLFVLVKRMDEAYLFHVFDQEGDFVEELKLDFQPWIFKNGFVYAIKANPDLSECEVMRFKVEFK